MTPEIAKKILNVITLPIVLVCATGLTLLAMTDTHDVPPAAYWALLGG